MSLAARALALADDGVNPVVVKELRQALRGRFVAGLLFLLLGVLLVTMAIFLAQADLARYQRTDRAIGSAAFFTILGFVHVATMVFVPGFIAARLFVERGGMDFVLMTATALTPSAIVRGKVISGITVAGLVYSVAVPFLVFTYLLRGIDLAAVLVDVTVSILVVLPALEIAIFIAVAPIPRALAILGLLAAALLGVATVPMLMGGLAMSLATLGTWVLDRQFWVASVCILAGETALVALLHSWSVAAVAPPASNRALPVRVTTTAAWLLSGVASLVYAARYDDGFILPWLYASAGGAALAMVAAASHRDRLGPRVGREVPRRRWLRVPAFVFFTSSAGGFLWGALLLSATLGTVAVAHRTLLTLRQPVAHLQSAAVIGLTGATYGLLAFLLQRGPLERHVPRRHAWILSLALLGLVSGCSGFIEMLASGDVLSYRGPRFWKIGNPFTLWDEVGRLGALYALVTALLVLLVVARRDLVAQVRAFHPIGKR